MKNRKSKSIPHLTPDQLCLAIMDQLAGLVDFYDHPKTHDLHEVAASAYGAANEAAWDGYRTKRDIIGAAKMTEKYGPKEARDE